jgi:protein FRA10AC1
LHAGFNDSWFDVRVDDARARAFPTLNDRGRVGQADSASVAACARGSRRQRKALRRRRQTNNMGRARAALSLPRTVKQMAAPPSLPTAFRSDAEALARHHLFIRTAEDDAKLAETNPAELRLARGYYNRLVKEYAIADLSLAQKRRDDERQLARDAAEHSRGAAERLADLRALAPPRIGLRWRTRAEVISGRGQLSCGGRTCAERAALSTFELPFRWKELGECEARVALVKVRLCPRCAALLPRGRGGRGGGGGGGGGSGGASGSRGRPGRGRAQEGSGGDGEGASAAAAAAAAAAARERRREVRSRSRSPPPPPLTAAAAPAAAAAPPPATTAVAPDDDDDGDGDDAARLDRMVQAMIDAFEAGAG